MQDSAHDLLKKHVGDMIAVFRHVHDMISRQLQDKSFNKFDEAKVLLTEIADVLNAQLNHLDGLGRELQIGPISSAKEALTRVTGFVTGTYDHMRGHPVSKDLRDNYVALTLCCLAYEMLHTTGLAVQHEPTAELGLRHLRQLTPFVTRIGQMIPGVLVRELADSGMTVDESKAEVAAKNNHQAWASAAHSTP